MKTQALKPWNTSRNAARACIGCISEKLPILLQDRLSTKRYRNGRGNRTHESLQQRLVLSPRNMEERDPQHAFGPHDLPCEMQSDCWLSHQPRRGPLSLEKCQTTDNKIPLEDVGRPESWYLDMRWRPVLKPAGEVMGCRPTLDPPTPGALLDGAGAGEAGRTPMHWPEEQ